MNQKSLLCSPLFHSFIILFFSLLTTTNSSSPDPKFEACEPKTCANSNVTISYPFYIEGKQESFCGYPEFGLSCDKNNGFPILNLSNQYIIHEIFYENQSLRVSDAAFTTSVNASTGNCLSRSQNLTLSGSRFDVVPNQKNLILFFDCDLESMPRWMQERRIGCSAENETSSVVALHREDQNLSFAMKNCKGGVVDVVVEDDEKEGIQLEVLRKGFLLNWTATDCSLCRNTGGRCGFEADIDNFRCYCPDRVHAWKCHPESNPATAGNPFNLKVKLAIGLGIGLPSILIIGLLLLFYKRKHATSGSQLESANTHSDSSLEGGSVYFGVPLFSYKELKEATNNFDRTRELGDGGFGTVYYGNLKDGREVAVKRLYEHNYRRLEQFMNEVEILTRLRHRNLVSLYGCTSRHSRELLLVYEYISNGTVAYHLHGELAKTSLLPWPIRLKIALETASALAYLHASDIIHRDVKTNNILLDSSFSVKVADFGLSRPFSNDVTHVSTAPQGTPGYVDPEYYRCYQLTRKSDVYSFGVVLVELISSKPAVDMNRDKEEINLSDLAVKKIQEGAYSELVDHSLGFDSDIKVKRMIVSVAELAFQCLQKDRELRPSMDEVMEILRRVESGNNDESEHKEEADVHHGDGVSQSNVHGTLPPAAPDDWDEVALLKNMRHPSSPNTVIDKWESKCTTPNVSG